MYQGMQAGVPEIGIVLRFREGRDGAFQLKEGEREVEKRHARSLIYRFTVSVKKLKEDQ